MANTLLTITISTHNFAVTNLTYRSLKAVNDFAKLYIQTTSIRDRNNHLVFNAVKVFCTATKKRNEYRFHINQLKDFRDFLAHSQITEHLIETIIKPVPLFATLTAKIKPEWKLRDEQVKAFEYLIRDDNSRSKMVDLQTGRGKTIVSLMAVNEIKARTAIIIKPAFIEKWIEDLNSTYDLSPGDVLVVKGSASLLSLIDLAVEGTLKAQFIIISNKTLQNWIKLYEEYGNDIEGLGYQCGPANFFEILQVGVRLIDEVHMDFHLNFKIDLYTNIEKSISLSATLLSNDPFISNMHEILHPTRTRFVQEKLDKYVNSYVVYYSFAEPDYLRFTEQGSNNYSHNALERSIIKNKHTLKKYLDLVNFSFGTSYVKSPRIKKRALIFAASIPMCTEITNYLGSKYPEYDVRRYVEDDPYSNIMEADVCVSTLGSAGTALDIPDLNTVILTVAVDSIQSNIQSLGRLRDLKNGDRTEFYYFAATNVDKHMIYAARKADMLERRAATFKEIFTNMKV